MPEQQFTLLNRFADLFEKAQQIWSVGGWAMYAIAAIALLMFGIGAHIWLRFRKRRFSRLKDEEWKAWIRNPELRKGKVGKILDFVWGAPSLEESFDQVMTYETTPFDRDLKVMKICVGAAPLVGLLGTVTGMLSTFNALSSGSGGDQTMGMVAGGISEALITTETGLVIALAGLFFQYRLAQKFDRYRAFLAHMESVCMQEQHKDQMKLATSRRMAIREAASRLSALRLRAAGSAQEFAS